MTDTPNTPAPAVPPAVRTASYIVLVVTAGIELFITTTASVLFGENALTVVTVTSASSAAVGLVAGGFGVFYRPTGPRA